MNVHFSTCSSNPINYTITKNDCIKYILDLSLNFRYFSAGHHIGFKTDRCSACDKDIILVYVITTVKRLTLRAHIVHSQLQALVNKLEDIRHSSHDFVIDDLRPS